MYLDVEVKKWGNSYGVRITKQAAQQLGLQEGDLVGMDLVKKTREPIGFGICKGAPAYEDDPHDDREY